MKSPGNACAAFGLLAALLVAPAFGTEQETAALSVEQKEDRTAFIARVRKARQGDTESQWHVAQTYVRLGAPVRAVPLLQAAAAAGHPQAASLLASLHEEGRGTDKSREAALRGYRFAAGHGQPEAMAALGRLLLQESGPGARESAWQWLRQAAGLGDRDGQYHLGGLLARPGVAHDDAAAFRWFLAAAEQGHVGAQIAAATHLHAGKGVAKDEKAALAWLDRAAVSRDPVANYLLGRLCAEEGAACRDKARQAYRVAAQAGHREARFALAVMLAGSGMAEERTEAVTWFAKAEQDGHKAAANRLGEAYRHGTGVAQSFDKAIVYFSKAATQGDAEGMYNLAGMQNDGVGGPRDTRQALQWYARAAEQGHEGAARVMNALLSSTVKTSALGGKGFWQ